MRELVIKPTLYIACLYSSNSCLHPHKRTAVNSFSHSLNFAILPYRVRQFSIVIQKHNKSQTQNPACAGQRMSCGTADMRSGQARTFRTFRTYRDIPNANNDKQRQTRNRLPCDRTPPQPTAGTPAANCGRRAPRYASAFAYVPRKLLRCCVRCAVRAGECAINGLLWIASLLFSGALACATGTKGCGAGHSGARWLS